MRNALMVLTIILVSFACKKSSSNKIIVAVAANMQYAMEELVKEFEKKHPAIKVIASSASSGTLTTQILQGAPFDVFVSANMKYPDKLYDEGLTVSPPKVYAHGKLILWSLKEDVDLKSGLKDLLEDNIKSVAIANKETAPYGIAAIEAIKSASLHDLLQPKFVMGESIGQVNQYTQSKVVDVGITSNSVLFSPKVKDKGQSLNINAELYNPIQQGIVVIKQSKHIDNAMLFYNFMFSKEAAAVLASFGYEVVND